MKAGFLFTNRSAAHRVLDQPERRRQPDKPRRRIVATLAAAVTNLFSR